MSMFFKRSMSALLAATMLTMAAPFDSLAVFAENLAPTVTIGSADVNGDKQVDEKDCALILEAIGSNAFYNTKLSSKWKSTDNGYTFELLTKEEPKTDA